MTEPKLELVDATNSDNPLDLAKLRVPQNFTDEMPVKKLLTTVRVGKPGPQDFIRVHASPTYRALIAVLELKDEREIYVVAGPIAEEPQVKAECYAATLFTAMTRTGTLFLWPVRVPASNANGKANDWHVSAAMAAEHAMRRWVRVKANMGSRAYDIFEAESKIPDPEWPAFSFQELVNVAFRDRLIDHLDHPVLKQLR
jgi:hypothetical protein